MLNPLLLGAGLPLFWYGAGVATLLAYPIYRMLLRLNSRQKVSEYAPATHQAKQGTPTMGGLMFVAPFLLVSLIPGLHGIAPITVLFLLFALIGFIDDFVIPRLMPGKRGLGWKQKLLMQLAAAAAYAWVIESSLGTSGIRFDQICVDVFLVLFCANAYNFADGLDGLASSIGLLLFPGLIVLNEAVGRNGFFYPLFLLGGAMIPFVYLNAPRAKVFMGDVGSLPIGALIGAMVAVPMNNRIDLLHNGGWLQSSNPVFLLSWFLLMLVLFVELVPVPLQILWVKVFKRRLFPFTPVHHAFEKAGWPETRVVALFGLVQLLCTLAALTLLVTSLRPVSIRL